MLTAKEQTRDDVLFLFVLDANLQRLPPKQVTEFEPSHGCHQKAHEQGRAAKGLDLSSSVLFFRCDRFLGPFGMATLTEFFFFYFFFLFVACTVKGTRP